VVESPWALTRGNEAEFQSFDVESAADIRFRHFTPFVLPPLAGPFAPGYQRRRAAKGGSVSQKGKIEQPVLRLVTAWPPTGPTNATLVLCPFLAGLDPAVAFWLGGLAWHDANGTLLEVIGAVTPARWRAYAGVFCVDPFRRDDDLFDALRRAGIEGIINLPTVSVIDGELVGILDSFQFGVGREIDFLRRAHMAGFRIAACVGGTEAADHAVAAGAELLVVHGGPPQPGAADRSRIAVERLRRRFANGPPLVSVTELLMSAA
jgi:hypothetical protein